MKPPQNDEFYIGWEAKAAPGIGKTVRNIVVALLLLALLAPVVLAVSRDGAFLEIGQHRLRFVALADCICRVHELALALASRER